MSTLSERRARYTPNQAFTNNFAARVCGIRPTGEVEWIEADIEANVRKAEKCQQHDECMALKDQNKYQGNL